MKSLLHPYSPHILTSIPTMKYNLTFTSPINPPFVRPALSQMQVWEGLLRKCRRPQDFLDILDDCHIINEDDGGMKRIMYFKPGMGPPSNQTTEVLTFHDQKSVSNLDNLYINKNAQPFKVKYTYYPCVFKIFR